jgi:hypothetical protein
VCILADPDFGESQTVTGFIEYSFETYAETE